MASFIVNFLGPSADEIRSGYVDSLNYLLDNDGSVNWIVGKKSKRGDRVLFYCASVSNARLGKVEKEIKQDTDRQLLEKTKKIRNAYKKYQGKIMALGTVISDAEDYDNNGEYESEIGDIVILNRPLDYAIFKDINKINSYGAITYLKEENYNKLFQMIVNDNPGQFENISVCPQSISEQEKEADELTDSILKKIAKKRSGQSDQHRVTTLTYYRDPFISVYAKRRAKGICDLCGEPAPFTDLQQKPYLECHHVVWLSKGGEDSIDNVVALCPNCHRRMHVLDRVEDKDRLNKRLQYYKSIKND